VNVQFDLGIVGLGLLILISLAFGALVQFVGKPGTSVDGLVAGVAWFIGALIASELVGVGGGERVIDGLALDAVVVGGGLIGVPLALVLRLYGDHRSHHHASA
jgi:hypothetical protein